MDPVQARAYPNAGSTEIGWLYEDTSFGEEMTQQLTATPRLTGCWSPFLPRLHHLVVTLFRRLVDVERANRIVSRSLGHCNPT